MARRAPLLVAAALAAAALPAAAQQAPPAGVRLVLPLPGAALPGWAAPGPPRKFAPEPATQPPGWAGVPAIDCGRDLPCAVRLRGVVSKYGGVALEGTAFTW